MQQPKFRFVGAELYFDDLETAKQSYRDTLQLEVSDEEVGYYAKFDAGSNFICLERKGSETAVIHDPERHNILLRQKRKQE